MPAHKRTWDAHTQARSVNALARHTGTCVHKQTHKWAHMDAHKHSWHYSKRKHAHATQCACNAQILPPPGTMRTAVACGAA